MSRVPDYPPKSIKPILTLAEHRAAGFEIVSVCSTGQHQHVIDFDVQIALYGGDCQPDYAWRTLQICPECRAPGGGVVLQQAP